MIWLTPQKKLSLKRIALTLVRRTRVSTLVVAALLIGVTYVSSWILRSENFPITGVQIVNDQGFVPEEVLTDIVMPHLGRGFIRLDVSAIAHSLMEEPWVRQVTVRRIWPDRLVIRIIEHSPHVLWNQTGIVTVEGRYIEPDLKRFNQSLPHLLGPQGRQLLVWEQFKTFEDKLQVLGLRINQLELAERGSWSLMLDSDTSVLLGKVEAMKRLERFIKSFDTIIEKQGVVPHTVDCRYTSGMAVS